MDTDIKTGTHLDKLHTYFSHPVLARPLTIALAAVRSKAPRALPEIMVCLFCDSFFSEATEVVSFIKR